MRSRKLTSEIGLVDAEAKSPIKETLASAIYDALRRDILEMALPAGSKLNIRALCDRFQVGLSPVREALSRLATERLVTQLDHRGFAVAPLNVDDLRDLTLARIAVDGEALRLSIKNGGRTWEEGLLIAFHWLSRTPRTLPGQNGVRSQAWETLHRDYHRALIAGCGSQRLLDFSAQLFEASNRYRHASRATTRNRSITDEHQEIMEAALAYDVELATTRLANHYRLTAELVEVALSLDPADAQGQA